MPCPHRRGSSVVLQLQRRGARRVGRAPRVGGAGVRSVVAAVAAAAATPVAAGFVAGAAARAPGAGGSLAVWFAPPWAPRPRPSVGSWFPPSSEPRFDEPLFDEP